MAMVTKTKDIPTSREISVHKDEGTTPFQLASYLTKTHPPPDNETLVSYFNPSFVNSADQFKLKKDELADRILKYCKPHDIYERLNYNYALNYLKYTPTGSFEVAIPTIEYIDGYILRSYNAICLITSSHYYDEKYDPYDEPFNNHFVVISKHPSTPRKYYRLHDPLCDSHTEIRKDVLLYSMNVATSKDNCGTGATVFFK